MTRALSAALCSALLLAGCGGSRSLRDSAGQAAAIAAELAAAAAIAVLTHRGRRETERGDEAAQAEPVHTPPLEDIGDREPEPSPRLRPLPLWHVPYAVAIEAEDLWCDRGADCVRVESVDGCAPEAGGVDLAVRRSSVAHLRAELADTQPSRPCPGHEDASHGATLHCLDNLCRLVAADALGPVPPPPAAPDGLAPVPPPP